jgi:hypothetical protein
MRSLVSNSLDEFGDVASAPSSSLGNGSIHGLFTVTGLPDFCRSLRLVLPPRDAAPEPGYTNSGFRSTVSQRANSLAMSDFLNATLDEENKKSTPSRRAGATFSFSVPGETWLHHPRTLPDARGVPESFS